jgi:hypothetical protein
VKWEKASPTGRFYRRREREGWSWSHTSVTAGRRLAGAAGPQRVSGPLFWVADQWASIGVLKGGASPNLCPSALFTTRPESKQFYFYFFQTDPNL